jgi:hypothetical protein
MPRTAVRPTKPASRKAVADSTKNVASAARTASGAYSAFPVGSRGINADIVASVVTGTNPTLDVYLEVSNDGGTTWYRHGHSGSRLTAAGTARAAFGAANGALARFAWDITGTTPSFTFAITAYEVAVSR